MTTTLPWEVIEHILHFLKPPKDLPTIRACSLVSHGCNFLMRPKVFHSITLIPSGDFNVGSTTARGFLSLLETSPDIAQYVKTLTISEIDLGPVSRTPMIHRQSWAKRWLDTEFLVVIKLVDLATELDTIKLMLHHRDWITLDKRLEQALEDVLKRSTIQAVSLSGINFLPKWFSRVLRSKRHLMVSSFYFVISFEPPSPTNASFALETLVVGPNVLEHHPPMRVLNQLLQPSGMTSNLRFLDIAIDGGTASRDEIPLLISFCSMSLEQLGLQLVPCTGYDVMHREMTLDLESLIDMTSFPLLHTISVSVPICAPGCSHDEHSSDRLLTILRSLADTIPLKSGTDLKIELTIWLNARVPVLYVPSGEFVWSWKILDSHLERLLQGGVQEMDIKILEDPEGVELTKEDLEGVILRTHLRQTSTSDRGTVRISKASELPCWHPAYGSMIL
ncbi:hypothetical protein BDN72DRAFT_440661 [Pluteus cervinus]|uniref:Uncharacterized protein n=1 Tax=Pluteus cervinus TaxID=181527 RepID=A0ACD3A840_9AGAR|nr:hypothetical protein BDN72DRAFT_440661 [Pluteus cervinus]